MDNTSATPVDNIDSLVETDQSGGLLGYINGQTFQSASPDDVVSIQGVDGSQENLDLAVAQNVVETATVPEVPVAPTTPPVLTDDVDKQRYERAIADLTAQRDQERQVVLRIASEARRREDALFEESLKYLDPEEAQAKRTEKQMEQIRLENQHLRTQFQLTQQEQENKNQEAAKGMAAYKLAQALSLPLESVDTLMSAETTTGMLNMARQLSSVYGRIPQAAAPQAPQATQAPQLQGVMAAGGEQAPAAPPPKTPQRSGDLLGMMRERGYVSVAY